jgi:hypothetical protein
MFFVVSINTATAQTEVKEWIFEIGINTVDVRTSNDFSVILEDYFNPKEWFGNTNFFVSRITAEKYISNNFSIQFAGSINNLGTIVTNNDSNASYFSLDVNIKHYASYIFSRQECFKPYLIAGAGFQYIEERSGIIAIGGIGGSFWLNHNIGVNLQTAYKQKLTGNGLSVFQHTIGLVFNFGAVSNKGARKRLWGN